MAAFNCPAKGHDLKAYTSGRMSTSRYVSKFIRSVHFCHPPQKSTSYPDIQQPSGSRIRHFLYIMALEPVDRHSMMTQLIDLLAH
jgi:hypothetical protein